MVFRSLIVYIYACEYGYYTLHNYFRYKVMKVISSITDFLLSKQLSF